MTTSCFSFFCFSMDLGLCVSKPDMITLLEQGKDPWMMKRKTTRGHCPGEHEDVGQWGCCWPSLFLQTHNLSSRHCGLVSMGFAVLCSLSVLQHSHIPLQTSYFSLHPSFAFQSYGLIFLKYMYVCMCLCVYTYVCLGEHTCVYVCLYVVQRSEVFLCHSFFLK